MNNRIQYVSLSTYGVRGNHQFYDVSVHRTDANKDSGLHAKSYSNITPSSVRRVMRVQANRILQSINEAQS